MACSLLFTAALETLIRAFASRSQDQTRQVDLFVEVLLDIAQKFRLIRNTQDINYQRNVSGSPHSQGMFLSDL